MISNPILVAGHGHLADRVCKLLVDRGALFDRYEEHIPDAPNTSGRWNKILLVDDRDEKNLEFLIAFLGAEGRPQIAVSLFNENVAAPLREAHPHVRIFNPAQIAAPVFLEALETPRSRPEQPLHRVIRPTRVRKDPLLKVLLISFCLILAISTAYFHFSERFSWLDSAYFVIVTASTVGYGDLNLANAIPLSKVVGILLILCSAIFIWAIFSLTTQGLLSRRAELSLGHRVYTTKGHIVLCGLGRLGMCIADELLRKGEKLVIVEKQADVSAVARLRARGVDIYIGDARLPEVLRDVGAERAKAVMALVNDDFSNLEIGLNARSFQPGVRVVLRVFDGTTAERIRKSLDIQLTFSMSAAAAPVFLDSALS